jgi:tRNA(Ile)-lysidine synthase
VFLVHALNYLKRKLGVEVYACHLDHGLRGRESEEDSRFVEGLAMDLGLQCRCEKIPLPNLKRKGFSTEEAGRIERYKFFRECARRFDANLIATGHTIDDQAETVLMRLIKGSSVKGASGIPPVREEALGLRIIRPLIELEKSELVEYLRENGIEYRVDATNLQNAYFRNVVRHEILPFLAKFNPRIKNALSNFAGHLRDDLAFIREEKQKRSGALIRAPGAVSLNLRDLIIQPRALVKEIVRDSLDAAGADMKKLTYAHWKAVESFIRSKRKGSSIDLPGGIRISRGEKVLKFFKLKTT